MIIRQLRVGKMAVFCYLVGDEETKTCALIDPAAETEKILSLAEKEGFQVSHVINTHGHSDHTTGNADIIHSTGAKLLIHRDDSDRLNKVLHRVFSKILGGKGSPKADILLHEGDVIQIGKIALQVIHTPGHTAGSICLYAGGNLFTGDTLFVGAVGRTDLPGGSYKQLLDSVHKKIYSLPDDTRIWPGHDYGPSPHSTVFRERETNIYTRPATG
ncbi:MAG: MBL fold metallo-hydrolase [Desulfobacterales bacterium]